MREGYGVSCGSDYSVETLYVSMDVFGATLRRPAIKVPQRCPACKPKLTTPPPSRRWRESRSTYENLTAS